jgi:hypothetical protein
MEPVFKRLEPQLSHRPPEIFRARDKGGIERGELRAEALMELVRHFRGVYSPRTAAISHSEALLFRTRHSYGTLETALFLHGLLPEEPSPIRIAIAHRARKPFVPPLWIEAFRYGDHLRPEDVVILNASRYGPRVCVFSLPMLAIEFLRLRNQIGRDYAYAMVDALFKEGVTKPDVLACAKRHGLAYPARRYLGRRRRLGFTS